MNNSDTEIETTRALKRGQKAVKLRPLFFSHDMLCCPTDYIGMISDLVSRGYVVFAPYH